MFDQNFKATDDIVKMEVWDVVDKVKKVKSPTAGLKHSHNDEEEEDEEEEKGPNLNVPSPETIDPTSKKLFFFFFKKQNLFCPVFLLNLFFLPTK